MQMFIFNASIDCSSVAANKGPSFADNFFRVHLSRVLFQLDLRLVLEFI